MAIPAMTELAVLEDAVIRWPTTQTYQSQKYSRSYLAEGVMVYKVLGDKKPTSTKQIRIRSTGFESV
jgi:hypothetical protein